jgi:single-strand DNA-binding protein
MSTNTNSVRLTGHLGADPELKMYGDNKVMAKASLATNERFRNYQGEWENNTQWHHLVFWGQQAAFAEQHLKKGTEISVEGRLNNRSYVDKEGITRYHVEVVVQDVQTVAKTKLETPSKSD